MRKLEEFADACLKFAERISPAHRLARKTAPVSPQGLTYAGFNARMLAATLDTALIALALAPFNDAVMGWVYAGVPLMPQEAALPQSLPPGQTPAAGGLIVALIKLASLQYVIFAAYSAFFWAYAAATPGKMLMRQRVVRASDGAYISAPRAALRALCYLPSGLPLMAGFLAIGWSASHRGWHDRLAGTAVVILPRRRRRVAAEGE